jgi:hypothetical protein
MFDSFDSTRHFHLLAADARSLLTMTTTQKRKRQTWEAPLARAIQSQPPTIQS